MKGKKMLLNGNGKTSLGKVGRICIFLLAIFMVVSCNNLMEPPTASGSGDGRAYLKISAGETARTVVPQLDFQNLSFSLTGSLSGGNSQRLGNWNTYSAMDSVLIALDIGEWIFTLTASNASGEVLEKSITKNVTPGTHILDFGTLDFSSGAGSVSVTLILPLNHGVGTASAALYEVSTNSLVTGTEQSLSLASQTDGRQAVTYTQKNVPKGNYFLKFQFTQALKSDVIDVYQELVQVAPHLTSSATRELAALNSYYQVTLDENGGSLSSTTTPSSFSRYEDVLLPTPTKTGYIFGGWYDKGDFNKTPVKTLPKGTDGAHNLTARWVQEVFVSATSGNDANFGVSSSPFKSLQAAVNAINAANDGTSSYIIKVMDNVDDSSSSSYDTSNNSALVNIAPTTALNLTIKSSDDNTQRTINAGRDASKTGRVMYVDFNATVTMQNLVLTGGNTTESGGGVYVNGGTLSMTSGSISHNTAFSGGGVYVSNGIFTMTSGNISDNNAGTNGGGGVYVASNTNLVIEGGSISGNTSTGKGGAINLNGTLTMSGGTISGNGSQGVYANSAQAINIGGLAYIAPDNDIQLGNGKFITITSELNGTTPIATISPFNYSSGTQILSTSSGSNVNLANEVGKFALAPSSDGKRYYINDSGNITEYLGESSSSVLSKIQSGNYCGTYVLNNSTNMSDIESILQEIATAKENGNDTSSLVLDLSLTTITSFTSPSGIKPDGATGSAAISLSEIIFPDTLTSLDTTAFQYASIRATFEDPDSMWTDTLNIYTKRASDIELSSGLIWNKN